MIKIFSYLEQLWRYVLQKSTLPVLSSYKLLLSFNWLGLSIKVTYFARLLLHNLKLSFLDFLFLITIFRFIFFKTLRFFFNAFSSGNKSFNFKRFVPINSSSSLRAINSLNFSSFDLILLLLTSISSFKF